MNTRARDVASEWKGGPTFLEGFVSRHFRSMPRWVRVVVYLVTFFLLVHSYLVPDIIPVLLVGDNGSSVKTDGWRAVYYVTNNRSTVEIGRNGELNVPMFSRARLSFAVTIEHPNSTQRLVKIGLGSVVLARLTGGSVDIHVQNHADGSFDLQVARQCCVASKLLAFLVPTANAQTTDTPPSQGTSHGTYLTDQKVTQALAPYADNKAVVLQPNPAAGQTQRAVQSMQVPSTERVIALVDSTILNSGKQGIVFTDRGLYYATSWTRTAGPKSAFVSYEDLSKRDIDRYDWSEVSMGDGQFFVTAGSDLSSEEMTNLLKRVKAAASQASSGTPPSQ